MVKLRARYCIPQNDPSVLEKHAYKHRRVQEKVNNTNARDFYLYIFMHGDVGVCLENGKGLLTQMLGNIFFLNQHRYLIECGEVYDRMQP